MAHFYISLTKVIPGQHLMELRYFKETHYLEYKLHILFW